ncbi:hypothetical protein QBC43DRAFT_357958, partial [Cladorrhinum sp. PSN259]
YQVRSVQGKGLGAVATRFIPAGTEVIGDYPVVMVDDLAVRGRRLGLDGGKAKLERLVARAVGEGLDGESKRYFGGLSGRDSDDEEEGWELKVFGKNAFRVKVKVPTERDGQEEKVFHVVFRDVSRVNHDCSPNMGYYFDQRTLRQRVVAARDIEPGEELSIGYVDLTKPSSDRQKLLHDSWGFTCTCRRCTLPTRENEESDYRAEQIHTLLKELDDYSSLEASPEKAELLVRLYEAEGIQARIYEAYYRAALEWNGVGNSNKAVMHARLCLEKGSSLRSEESPFLVIMRRLIENPGEHWSWGFRLRLTG